LYLKYEERDAYLWQTQGIKFVTGSVMITSYLKMRTRQSTYI